ALGVLAVLASAFGGEDDGAVLGQGHGADGLVTAGDAAGLLTADVGEMREVGVPLGVEEGGLGGRATALIRQGTLQAAGAEAAGRVTCDGGEMREVGGPLGVEEGVLGDHATALIRQETLQAAGVEESGHSVVGRHSSILVLNRESETDPVGKLPGAPSERGRRPVGAGKLPRVPEDYRKFGA